VTRSQAEPFTCDVSDIGVAGVSQLAADLFVPEAGPTPPNTVVVCVPGGGISRRYFDLSLPAHLDSYSMARYLARRGTVVVTIDPPAVGDSDTPEDPYDLTPAVVASILASAAGSILARLGLGSLSARLAPMSRVRAIGVGHSAGGLLTVLQQHRHRTYQAIAVLGFGGAGLPEFLSPHELSYAGDPARLRQDLAELTRERFGTALPVLGNVDSHLLVSSTPPPEVLAALAGAGAPLLGLVGMSSIIPGSVCDSTSAIDVPVFIGVGEHDIAATPQAIATEFASSTDLTLFRLEGSGHNHNVSDQRHRLWDRLVAWSDSLDLDLDPQESAP
jgi:pimeloyl-ACP methyl ester carboxylesterase